MISWQAEPQPSGSRTREHPDEVSAKQGFRRRPPAYLDGPNPTLVAMGVVMVLALLLLGMGFSRPLHRTGVRAGAYRQAGTFSYTAATNAPNSVYPSGLVNTGDPIYPSLVDTVSVRFEYRFASALPHHIKGTIELRGLVLSQTDTWQQLSTVVPVTKFSGDKASTTSEVPLASLYTFIDSVSSESGIAGTNYSVDIQPVVHITGTVDGRSIAERFSPLLPFAVSRTAIRVDAPVAPAPPGATFEPTSAGTALTAALHPAQSGSIPRTVANSVSIARYEVDIAVLRGLGIGLGVILLALALVHDRRRRRRPRLSDEQQIAKRLNTLIVPVSDLGPSEGRTSIPVPDFESLAGLARFLERPILYAASKESRMFAVDDDRLRYLTPAIERRQARPPGDAPPAGPTVTPKDPRTVRHEKRLHRKHVSAGAESHGVTTGSHLARGAAGLLAVAVAATLTVSLTASTTVPASRASKVFYAGAVSQGAPAGCSTVAANLTSLVQRTGTFSNNASHALILGGSGVDRITDTGQYNCIVGGAGKDIVNATSTDVCIKGPTPSAKYNGCTVKNP